MHRRKNRWSSQRGFVFFHLWLWFMKLLFWAGVIVLALFLGYHLVLGVGSCAMFTVVKTAQAYSRAFPNAEQKLLADLETVTANRATFQKRLSEIDETDADLAPRAQRRIEELRTLVGSTQPLVAAQSDPHVRVALDVLKEVLSRQIALKTLRAQIAVADVELSGLQEKIEIKLATAKTLSEESLAAFRRDVDRALVSYSAMAATPLDRLPAPRLTDEDVWKLIR